MLGVPAEGGPTGDRQECPAGERQKQSHRGEAGVPHRGKATQAGRHALGLRLEFGLLEEGRGGHMGWILRHPGYAVNRLWLLAWLLRAEADGDFPAAASLCIPLSVGRHIAHRAQGSMAEAWPLAQVRGGIWLSIGGVTPAAPDLFSWAPARSIFLIARPSSSPNLFHAQIFDMNTLSYSLGPERGRD